MMERVHTMELQQGSRQDPGETNQPIMQGLNLQDLHHRLWRSLFLPSVVSFWGTNKGTTVKKVKHLVEWVPLLPHPALAVKRLGWYAG